MNELKKWMDARWRKPGCISVTHGIVFLDARPSGSWADRPRPGIRIQLGRGERLPKPGKKAEAFMRRVKCDTKRWLAEKELEKAWNSL
jgi:hypothetical protein